MEQKQKSAPVKYDLGAAFRILRAGSAWVIVALTVLGAGLVFGVAIEVRAAREAPAPEMMSEGGKLFAKHCAACHQANGKGIPETFPPLAGNPNLKNTKLVVDSIHGGRSGPIAVNGEKFNSTMPPIGAGFSPRQVAAVATYIRNSWGNSFGVVTEKESETLLHATPSQGAGQAAPRAGAHPAGGSLTVPTEYAPPDARILASSLKGMPRGGRLFRLNCAACHDVTGVGGALVVGTNAPDLGKVPVVAVPVFMRMGPGQMPSFPPEVLSDEDAGAVAKYVGFLHSKPNPGGFSLGFLGPVTEGFVAIMIGLLAIVLCAIWIEKGEKG